MSDQTDTPTEPLPEGTDTPEGEQHTDGANREAARYRRQLREAEGARDALQARLAVFQQAQAEQLATGPGRLVDPSDLWRTIDLAAVLDDQGQVDPEKVTAAVSELVAAKPHYAQPPDPVVDLDLGYRGGTPARAPVTWADALATPRRNPRTS